MQEFSTNPVFIDAPAFETTYTVDVQCSTDRATCSDSDTVTAFPADSLEVDLVDILPGSIDTAWRTPNVGGPYRVQVVGVGIDFDGNTLRSLGGPSLSADLKNSLCRFSDDGVADPPSANANTDVSYTESSITVDLGEVFGYLAVGTDELTGVVGSLGRADEGGIDRPVSRGRIRPDALSLCP